MQRTESRAKFSSFGFACACYHTFHSNTLQTAVNLQHKELQPNRVCKGTWKFVTRNGEADLRMCCARP